jgi:GTP-binding protein LepA
MVFAGIYPTLAEDYKDLRDAIENSTSTRPPHLRAGSSPVLGFGFRCGFLGLLHLDVVRERLEREFGLALVVTVPGVSFNITLTSGKQYTIPNPDQFPDPAELAAIEEPWVKVSIITPSAFIGPLMELLTESEGVYKHTEYLGAHHGGDELGQRVRLEYELPLRCMLTSFYDQLKSRSRGYASLDRTHRIPGRPAGQAGHPRQ